MELNKNQKQKLLEICSQLLIDLSSVSEIAETKLNGRTHGGNHAHTLAAGTNTMVDGAAALINLNAISQNDIENLKRLEREPFVSRVVVQWEDGNSTSREILYISRASVAGITDLNIEGKLVTYMSAVGRVAEFGVGDNGTIQKDKRKHDFSILERVRFRPSRHEGQWDAIDDSFEFEPWSVAIKSVRQFLEQLGYTTISDGEIVDFVSAILQQEANENLVSETLRRKVIERIALRDQPILDQYQGEIFRLPVNKQLIMLGPPGTGKTTTLIRRLAQKRSPNALTEAEKNSLSDAGFNRASAYSNSWVMFSPTELLKLYLRDAFNNEGIPASEENLKTWDKERRYLARDVLKILRSADFGHFRLDNTAKILSDTSNSGICRLYEEFETYFDFEILGRCTTAYKQLQKSDNDELQKSAAAAVGRRRTNGSISVREISNLLEQASHLQPILERLDKEIKDELHRLINRMFSEHRNLLDELIVNLSTIVLEENLDDVDDIDDEDEDADIPKPQDIRNKQQQQQVVLKLIFTTLRSLARAIVLGRTEVGGRAGRMVKFLGNRIPSTESLSELGNRILTRANILVLVQAPRMFVMDVPKNYSRFRRKAIKEGQFFKLESSSLVKQNRISPEETDILILMMFRNTRRLFEESPALLSEPNHQDWLANIKSQYLMQVFVDEATDFSAVQLACTMELSHPRLRSWFACGDFNQRITGYGIQNSDEITWLNRVEDTSIELKKVNTPYRQSYRLKQLGAALSIQKTEPTTLNTADIGNDADVWPLLAENHTGENLAIWLADRISEVENALGMLPSIAVFVDGDDKIDSIVNLVQPLLEERNIPVVGCKEGRVVGD